MDTNNVFEVCLLNRADDDKLRDNDPSYHHYKQIYTQRENLEVRKERVVQAFDNFKSTTTVVKSMQRALESYPPFGYIFRNHVAWNYGNESSSSSGGGDTSVRIYSDIKDHPCCLLLYVVPKKACYVINHRVVNENVIRDLIKEDQTVTISHLFNEYGTQATSSVVINVELDILRVVLAILINDFDTIMKGESLDYIAGILTNDELKTKFINAKSIIDRIKGKTTNDMYDLNIHVAHYMTQLHHLWLEPSEHPYIPLMSLLDSVSRKRCCKTLDYPNFMKHQGIRNPPSKRVTGLVKSDMLSSELYTRLNRNLEMSLTPFSIKHPYPERTDYDEKKSIVNEKTSIIHSIMTDDDDNYVERETLPFEGKLRLPTKRKASVSKLVDVSSVPATQELASSSMSSGDDTYSSSYYSLDDEDQDGSNDWSM
jgi:hypothetical protein